MANDNKHQLLVEYAKIMSDPVYGIETYMETFDMTQNSNVPFNLFSGQKLLIKNYEENRFNLCLKYRQAGITTVTAAYCAIKIGFADPDRPERVLILANKQDTAIGFLQKITSFIKQLPGWAGIKFLKESQKHCIITNAEGKVIGEIKAVATSKDALRGYTPTLMILDEAAFIEGGQELWSACLASISTGGNSILISTPNGLDTIYYAAYEQAILGKNNFKITDLKWWQDPRYIHDLKLIKCIDIIEWIQRPIHERTEHIIENVSQLSRKQIEQHISDGYKPHTLWFENMCRDMNFNKRMVNQELECAFLGSGDNVIEGSVLRKQEIENVKPPVAKDAEWDHNVWIWKAPEAGHRYIAAADVSRGDSEDATGYTIIDFDTWEQVVEYHGKITPDIAALLVNKYSIMYNALSTFDITGGMGVATTAKLKDLKFPTKLLHYDKIEDVDQLFGVEDTVIPGINFASYNRRTLIVQALEEALRTGFKIRSERLCAELKKFIYKNGKADHMKNSHDDLIMALGMCLYVANTSFKKLAAADSATKAMLESWRVHNTPKSTNPAMNMLRDIISSPEPNKTYDNNNQFGSRQNLETTKEFSWLFGDLRKFRQK